jgi:hypothetical protein
MKNFPLKLILTLLALLSLDAAAVTRYVYLNSPSPTPPYTNWLTAATNIQDAIDAADAGDLVLVTNGVYATGGKVMYGVMTNRIAITKALIVESVNGASVTTIFGGGNMGASSGIRCAYLTNGATLIGFTLTNGYTKLANEDVLHERSGGGVWCTDNSATISNCVFSGNAAQQYGGGAFRGTLLQCTLLNNHANRGGATCSNVLINCTVSYNSAPLGGGAANALLINCNVLGNGSGNFGGGAYFCTLSNCFIGANSASYGAGANNSALFNCTISNNFASYSGGGAHSSTLENCLLFQNSSVYGGGGAYSSTLNKCILRSNVTQNAAGGGAAYGFVNNCILVGNTVQHDRGGGSAYVTMNNCEIVGNWAISGGGVYASTLNNCTVVGNVASSSGGGGWGNGDWTNCIVYFNVAPSDPNYRIPNASGPVTTCCTTPMPLSGRGATGNVTNPPIFMDANGWSDLRLHSNSPCINAGLNSIISSSKDFDGNPRIVGGTVDIGAYEFQSPSSVLSYAWAQQNGLATDGSADFTDADGDGMNNYGEWRSDTIPTNALSVLKMVNATNSPTGAKVSWQSVATRSYWLERATNLGVASPFQIVATNIAGVAGTKTFTDTSATNNGPYFYRVGVQ